MKPISSMTEQELTDLLSYTLNSGATIYYSNITIIDKDGLIYNNKHQKVNPTTLALLKTGKLKYEQYALSLGQKDAELLLEQKAKEVLKEVYEEKVSNLEDTIYNTLNKISNFADRLNNNIQAISEDLKTSSHLQDTFSDLSSKLNDFDPEPLNQKLNAKVKEVESVKEDIEKKAKKVFKEFDSVTDKLKELFKD